MTPNKIAEQLRKASKSYYNTGKAIMSDDDFDKLRDHLKKVDPDNNFFSEVGAAVHRNEVKLKMHMGSQNKAKDQAELEDWYNKYNSPEVIVSDKLDGSSMEVIYEGGELIRVATRGNGEIGMDITRNAKLWNSLPHSIKVKDTCIVRGEAQLSVTNWKANLPDAINPRNGGNGIVVCDTDYERNKYIDFHAFDIVHPEVDFKQQSHKFKTLKALGFTTARWFRCKNIGNLLKCRVHYENDRSTLDFEIDGMVVAIEDLAVQEKLGYSDGGTRPRGQIAWKFNSDRGVTEVIDITLTIGHTGKIIPTAVLKPIQLAGTTVTHCLLNNFDYIEKLGLDIGDKILVEKAGDIIPHTLAVIGVDYKCPKCGFVGDYIEQEKHHLINCSKQTFTAINKKCYQPPDHWRSKDGNDYPLTKEGADWKVTDEDCPDLNFQRIRNWINKTGIKQLGDNALMSMIDNKVIEDIDDLYGIKAKDIENLPVGKSKIGGNAKKIISEIDKTRSMTIDLFIGSLSIKHLGRSRAALLEIDTLDYYLNLSRGDLVGKKCSDKGTYGEEVAHEVYDSLQKRKDLILKLKNYIKIEQPKQKVTNGALSGKIFCFSGVRMNSDQKQKFEGLGGEESKKVDEKLTYLVLKDTNSTSSKAEKARKLNINIISLDEFDAMLN